MKFNLLIRNQKLLVLSCVFSLIACDLENQKAQEVFADNQMPRLLEELANPKPSGELLQSLLQKSDENRLRVAVIDNGVEYLHPDLVQQIRFTKKDGQIVGAGKDVFGADDWAAPVHIRATILAFGATGIQGDRIVGPNEHAIQDLIEINEVFEREYKAELALDEEVKHSIFIKAQPDSINFLGALGLVREKEDQLFKNRMAANTNILLSEATKNSLTTRVNFSAASSREIFEKDWKVDSSGLPNIPVSLHNLLGYEKYLSLIERVINKVFAQTRLKAEIDSFFAYKLSREDLKTEATKDLELKYISELAKYLYHAKSQRGESDLAYSIATQFCEKLSPDEKQQLETSEEGEKIALIKRKFVEARDRMNELTRAYLTQEGLSEAQREDSQKSIETSKNFEKVLTDYIQSRGTSPFVDCSQAQKFPNVPERYKNFELLDRNPYLANDNLEVSHGTHVSGIIASQDAMIDIVPVRVLTQTVESQKDSDQKNQSIFLAALEDWLKYPVIQAAVKDLLGLSEEGTAVSQKTLAKMKDYLRVHFKEHKTDLQFIPEVLDGIRYTGSQKIKVANVSLGTDFSKAPTGFNPNDTASKLKQNLNFLMYEVYKYQVAKTVLDAAPETLFVIASGNSANWVDGKTRSALPCDLSPSFLQSYKNKFNINELPNENFKNILCVGSIGPNGDLSSFTNYPLTRTPFVVSYGESILSSIKSSDCNGEIQDFEITYGKTPEPGISVSLDSDWFEKYLTEKGLLKANLPLEEKRIQIRDLANDVFSIDQKLMVKSIYQAARTERCLNNRIRHAKLSGTSMASPAVAGYIGRWLREKLSRDGLSDSDAYLNPDYSPRSIIKAIFNQAPRLSEESTTLNIPMISDIRPFKGSVDESKAKNLSPNLILFK